ncbi:NAD(+) diphosphatase [Aquipuribacter sp. SD81]|uniref:NAD(+) diphosphatase n=1 Tax=Aquipuribacter sp. SD81 TaxID=3127703 RepID=UPI003018E189
MALADLSLSRSRLDKVSDDRSRDGLLAELLADPTTHLLVVADGRAAVRGAVGPAGSATPDGDGSQPPGVRLALLHGPRAAALVAALGGPAALAAAGTDPGTEAVAVHLGRFPAGDAREPGALVGLLGAAARGPLDLGPGPDAGAAPGDLLDGADPWLGLREVGALLDDTDAGALTEAVALEHWHATSRRCGRCGSPTRPVGSGHERVCVADGTTHHPRHDPAVIMTVTDPQDRLLLGHQGRWPEGRFSAFAGFVEPGESLEQAVEREVLEEAGVRVRHAEYLGSQPWPFPASLMLAFHAETDDTEAVPDGAEITETRWFTRDGLREAVAAGEVTVPPRVSVARRLVERWLGGPLHQDGSWR